MTFEDFWENYENETGYYSDEMFDCAKAAWDARGKVDAEITRNYRNDKCSSPTSILAAFDIMTAIERG